MKSFPFIAAALLGWVTACTPALPAAGPAPVAPEQPAKDAPAVEPTERAAAAPAIEPERTPADHAEAIASAFDAAEEAAEDAREAARRKRERELEDVMSASGQGWGFGGDVGLGRAGRVGAIGPGGYDPPPPEKRPKPTVEVELSATKGPREPAAVVEALKNQAHRFRACHERSAGRDAGWTAVITGTIEALGRPTAIGVTGGTASHASARACMEKLLAALRWDAAADAQTFTAEVRLAPP